jgi:hypothetical protein
MDPTVILSAIGLLVSAVTIFAIYYGPIAALRIQRQLDDARETRNRKQYIFKTMMTYRATPLHPNFVQALNLIDVEFIADNDDERAVRDAWKELLDHFNNYNASPNPVEKSRELTAILLSAIGKSLGYRFDKVYLKKGAYYPELAMNVEQEQHALRRSLLEVLEGRRRIPVGIFEDRFPDIALNAEEVAKDLAPAPEAKKLGEPKKLGG